MWNTRSHKFDSVIVFFRLRFITFTKCSGPSSSCNLYESGNMCKSTCSTCGNACQARRVTDRGNLEYYYRSNCTVIFGTLYIASVADLVPSELMRAFSGVEIIRGDLVVDSNPTIVSLECFGRLGRVDNVFISNNPSLVDARLPLATFDGGVYVSNNVRLCPSYWPDVNAMGGGSNAQDCAYVDMTQLVLSLIHI